MTRTRRSAKQAGARFERQVADYLRDNLDDHIDRKVQTGTKDTGDIANVRDSHGRLLAIECKDYGGKLNLPQWLREVEAERLNYKAEIGVVIAKKRGTTDPAKQYVVMELNQLVKLLLAG